MSRTRTQKKLLQAQRAGSWCAENNRRVNKHYSEISQHVRVTPSKQQQLNKVKHKERIFHDGAPFLLQIIIYWSRKGLHLFSALHSILFGGHAKMLPEYAVKISVACKTAGLSHLF